MICSFFLAILVSARYYFEAICLLGCIRTEIGWMAEERTPRADLVDGIVPNIDLPALSSPKFKPGPPGDEAQTYSNWLNELLVS